MKNVMLLLLSRIRCEVSSKQQGKSSMLYYLASLKVQILLMLLLLSQCQITKTFLHCICSLFISLRKSASSATQLTSVHASRVLLISLWTLPFYPVISDWPPVVCQTCSLSPFLAICPSPMASISIVYVCALNKTLFLLIHNEIWFKLSSLCAHGQLQSTIACSITLFLHLSFLINFEPTISASMVYL